jgi:hypothetical protein
MSDNMEKAMVDGCNKTATHSNEDLVRVIRRLTALEQRLDRHIERDTPVAYQLTPEGTDPDDVVPVSELAMSRATAEHYCAEARRLRRQRNIAATAAEMGTWHWSDSDPNELESLCEDALVTMTAGQLRAMLPAPDAAPKTRWNPVHGHAERHTSRTNVTPDEPDEPGLEELLRRIPDGDELRVCRAGVAWHAERHGPSGLLGHTIEGDPVEAVRELLGRMSDPEPERAPTPGERTASWTDTGPAGR